MAKTLRITTFCIAVLALALIILIAARGLASSKDFEKFLAVPGVAEQLVAGSAGSKATDVGQVTPLLVQAKGFALRINPPPPPAPVRQEPPPEQVHPKVEISAKFTLVGTSYHTGDEANSWALINEAGKGWHWVKQGEKIGYLVVEGIGDGVVLIRDGANTYELSAERQQKPDYVKSFTGTTSEKTIPAWQGKKSAVTEAVSADRTSVSSTENAAEAPKPTKEEIQENINWIKQIQENPQSAGMTAEEAKELGDLGDMLKGLETEAKTTESNEPNAPVEPNSVKIKDANEQKSAPEVTEKQQSEPNKPAGVPSRRGLRRDRR